MSDEQDEDRRADIRIVRAADASYYRVDVQFRGHIKCAVRWDDREEDARLDVLALIRDADKVFRDAFNEIDIERGAESIDAELDALFNPKDEQ